MSLSTIRRSGHRGCAPAPVYDTRECLIERRAVVSGEAVAVAEGLRGGEDIRGDDLIEEALELAICDGDAVEGFELLTEVLLEGRVVSNVVEVRVFECAQLLDELFF